jgi:hypothetical protein
MSNRTTINKKANREIKQQVQDLELSRCEINLPECMNTFGLGAAHRHKRRWYYDKPAELLWNRSQWVLACAHCHQVIEVDVKLTESIFTAKFGKEEL